ncbi:MAG: ATP-binding protein [Candidatus Anammoxibacter sp.]
MTKNKEPNPSDIKKAFIDYDQKIRIERSKIICLLIIALMPAGTLLDYFVYPDKLWDIFTVRIFSSFIGIVIWLLLKSSLALKHPGLSSKGWYIMLMPIFFISWMIAITEGSGSPYYAGLCLMLLIMHSVVHITVPESLLFVTILISMYAGACFIHGPIQDTGIFFNNLYFLVLTSIIVITGNYFLNRLRFREFSLRYELDRNQQLLQESNLKLIEMDRVKTSFFANINHELRTPLTLLIAPLEKIRHKEKSFSHPETKEQLDIMYSNAMRLLKLINNLLDLVKLDSGKMEVNYEPLDIKNFIKGLVSSVKGAGRDKKLIIDTSIEENIEIILADHDKLEKIILNLLFNSIKFTPAGGHIEIRAQKKNYSLCISVQDTGIGIPEKSLPYIFDRFWQADSSSRRKYQGTGIGLSLVKELVEAHKGEISAQSQEGKGATITVRIPYKPAAEKDIRSTTAGSGHEGQLSDRQDRLNREAERFQAKISVYDAHHAEEDIMKPPYQSSVLVADDEPDMLRFLKSELKGQYHILEATDGRQAVEKAKQFLPDLIILDMMMPEKDGLQVNRELREHTPTKSIPIILLTARVDENIKIRSLSEGVNDFLTKPFSGAELHARVKNLIREYRLQLELAGKTRALENALEELKETHSQLLQTAKLASLGRLSAGMIHEINNPLNFVFSSLHVLHKEQKFVSGERQPKYNRALQTIEDGLQRVKHIVSDLRGFTHSHQGEFTHVALHEAVKITLRFLSDEVNKNNIQMEVSVPDDHMVWGNKNQLIQVLLNLLQNSVDACMAKTFEHGLPMISVKSNVQEGHIKLIIRDNGEGIAEENIDKILDPFFTTKDVGQGMGLGLSICYRIVQQHSGHINVRSELGEFTEVSLELPVSSDDKNEDFTQN